MQRHEFDYSTTLEERLIDLARKVRADMETLPPCKRRDDLIQQLREVEAGVEWNPFR
ncbi:hypothetical protein JQ629_02610 [Bradyrhizobium sp. AUGA SZCCT0222]|uniref:hypothetical protein n=1 Tax=Bradyrhizobium sp. AUGA SZCCT0222 TaxID=2807668 RepID=UPI001BA7E343|nr:hypothetical protein [Bradyrhizobium sp. AUGA SZCCT0222]MBR1266392.1 hypothetical protein [Bradyrhizobium sp. AUGA SZCCT0222]